MGSGSKQHDFEFPAKMSLNIKLCSSDVSWNESSFHNM